MAEEISGIAFLSYGMNISYYAQCGPVNVMIRNSGWGSADLCIEMATGQPRYQYLDSKRKLILRARVKDTEHINGQQHTPARWVLYHGDTSQKPEISPHTICTAIYELARIEQSQRAIFAILPQPIAEEICEVLAPDLFFKLKCARQ